MSRPRGLAAYRTAVVTGASSGIGWELSRQLAAAGLAVGLVARRVDCLERLAAQIGQEGGRAFVAPADVADAEAVRESIQAIERALGPIDLLVANAGISVTGPASGLGGGQIRRLFEVNVLGLIGSIEAVLPGMLERGGGRIVGISSLAGNRGVPGAGAYSASKAAVTVLLEGLRVELEPRGVGVTTVKPGFVTTPMIAGATFPKPWEWPAERAARAILRGIARGRRQIAFPWPMAALMRVVSVLPGWAYEPLARRAVPIPGSAVEREPQGQ